MQGSSYEFKLGSVRFEREIGRSWFSNEVVDKWSGFSNEVAGGESLVVFKRKIYKFTRENESS